VHCRWCGAGAETRAPLLCRPAGRLPRCLPCPPRPTPPGPPAWAPSPLEPPRWCSTTHPGWWARSELLLGKRSGRGAKSARSALMDWQPAGSPALRHPAAPTSAVFCPPPPQSLPERGARAARARRLGHRRRLRPAAVPGGCGAGGAAPRPPRGPRPGRLGAAGPAGRGAP
jgi:hypothetical protein